VHDDDEWGKKEIKWKILNKKIRTNNDWKKFMSQQNEGILIKGTMYQTLYEVQEIKNN
jgi:hypothetical protein